MSYSPLYHKMTTELDAWFVARLTGRAESIRMTPESYRVGCDALKEGDLRAMVKEADEVWKKEKNYELSYSQTCVAFFGAANRLGIIEVN